ncbi:hypothetical protein Pcinc_010354 [Petrolisthes cinctipes]|uniref:Uncharacterized protein n=1 Tax=Petrolisthes cinctipes TaxID=88211 RepID=A0AAE1KHL3_PETCI|nr:hypothetical protein Pcinc_019537 [Petrolisthes cinctipes]KAK3883495.1 hypothetical protein Pcinc_012194 [Petrolisthes cinctipes]KAK3885426.1 hypothetical protein Pcinc_010342 [Petrolisthes cinctipes]KAK3885439.1 hypothetical protein Pcinc_010354 [Petrolisthes cinctipes]
MCVYMKGVVDRVSNNGCVLQVSEIIKTLNPESTITFLEMAWKGLTRGRVYIRVSEDTTEDKQFVGLCTGQPGSSFLNTRLHRVLSKGEQSVCMFGGNYNFNDYSVHSYCNEVVIVSFKSDSERVVSFASAPALDIGLLVLILAKWRVDWKCWRQQPNSMTSHKSLWWTVVLWCLSSCLSTHNINKE